MIDSRAYARASFLGNPSDGYHGKTLGIIVKNFGAQIVLWESPELHIEPQQADSSSFRNIYHLQEDVKSTGYNGGIPLIKATIKRFTDYCDVKNIRLTKNFTVRYSSSIPRQVGLAGSSAIVIATLKALMQFYEVVIEPELLPTIALQVETNEMGINAGLQDRVLQCYEGCVHMDFDKEFVETHNYGKYEPIDTGLLPKFYLAYKTNLSKVSGKVLNEIKEKFDVGDKHTIATLRKIADLADKGKEAILAQDYESLGNYIDQNFDYRCEIMTINDSNMQMINAARSCGASATFTGSGGAIIGMYDDDEMLNRLVFSLKKLDIRVLKPYLT
ncbi:MAG: hypothetical protein WBG71_04235 [Leeuwenhoekiella sp.]